MAKNRSTAVMGHHLPAPRPTRTAVRLLFAYVFLPVMGVLLALDVGLYLVFRHIFGSCYGILCLF